MVLSYLANDSHLPQRKDIQLSTYAILFFGTPHQGSDLTSWGYWAQRFMSMYSKTDDRLVQHLKSQSETIGTALGDFASLATSIKMINFYETLPTPVFGGRPVMVCHSVFQASWSDCYRLSRSHTRYLHGQMLSQLTQDGTIQHGQICV